MSGISIYFLYSSGSVVATIGLRYSSLFNHELIDLVESVEDQGVIGSLSVSLSKLYSNKGECTNFLLVNKKIL